MEEINRAKACMEGLEKEWVKSKSSSRDATSFFKRKKNKKVPMDLYDKEQPVAMFNGTIDDWKYVGVPGRRQVLGFVTNFPGEVRQGSILTSLIVGYDSETGIVTTKTGNRYRLGSPEAGVDFSNNL